MGKPQLVQFGVWTVDPNGCDEVGYWQTYDTLEDAVSDNGDGTEVYRLDATKVGTFKRSVSIVRVPKRKRAKKAA